MAVSVSERVSSSWPWYLLRASGLLAAILLFTLIISGIGMVTGWTYRITEPTKAWTIHKALAYGLLACVLIHMTTLLIDNYMSFTLSQLFIPFTSTYSNNTKLLGIDFKIFAVADGVLAFYGIILVVGSSLGWLKWIENKKRLWHWLHYASYVVVLLMFIHSLNTGTDLKSGWLRSIWIILLIFVIMSVVSRLRRAGTTKVKLNTDK